MSRWVNRPHGSKTSQSINNPSKHNHIFVAEICFPCRRWRCASRTQADSDGWHENPNNCFIHVGYFSTVQKTNMLTNSNCTGHQRMKEKQTKKRMTLFCMTSITPDTHISDKICDTCCNCVMQINPTRMIFALSFCNHMFNMWWLMSDRPAKIHQLDVYKKITSVSLHKMKFFRCVFNGVKLRHTQTRHLLTGGPSPASAGSSGAKISRFALDMAMKNNTVVASLENFYWHAPTAELTDFIGPTSHPGLHEHCQLKLKWFSFRPICGIFGNLIVFHAVAKKKKI